MTPEDIQIIDLSGDVKLLEEQLAAATARAEAAEAKLAAVPWGAIGRILDRIETPEDRYAVALWHLENRGM